MSAERRRAATRAVGHAATIAAIASVLVACTPAPPRAPLLRTLRRGSGDGPVIVLLHGYGSRPEDFLSFSARTDLPSGTRFVFPCAPEPTTPPHGPLGGFMWWSFPGEFHDPRAMSFPGMAVARQRVTELLDALEVELHVPSERIVLGGFSQGAMLSMDVALHDPRPLAGLLLLSGTFVDEAEWVPRMPSRRGLRVLQTHGRGDTVLFYPPAEALSRELSAAGVDVRFVPFEGGHEVNAEVSAAVGRFVNEVAR